MQKNENKDKEKGAEKTISALGKDIEGVTRNFIFYLAIFILTGAFYIVFKWELLLVVLISLAALLFFLLIVIVIALATIRAAKKKLKVSEKQEDELDF